MKKSYLAQHHYIESRNLAANLRKVFKDGFKGSHECSPFLGVFCVKIERRAKDQAVTNIASHPPERQFMALPVMDFQVRARGMYTIIIRIWCEHTKLVGLLTKNECVRSKIYISKK